MVLPRGGTVLRFLLSPSGYVLCVVCPFAVLALYLLALKLLEDRGPGGSWMLKELVA